MPTLKTVTFGCKVNQYETQYLCEGLTQLGYRKAVDGEPVDLCVVNTCTVTAEAEGKSRRAIRRLARENPGAEIFVMGCYATRAAAEIAAMPGVSQVVTDKRRLPEVLMQMGVADVPLGISTFGSRHRAYVKIQDGCQMQCAYCIIPQMRPYLASRRPGEAEMEIGQLVENGFREIVLTGIHLGHYGVDASAGGCNLAQLLGRLVALDGDFRIRLSSLEAVEVTDELLEVMAEHPRRICPHLHLSMQSGSNAVLERMRRRWPAEQFLACCQRAQRVLDFPSLTTDVIVGFPGETDEDFAASCRAIEQVGFSRVHVFRFSPRQGTAAATMADQVPEPAKQQRAAELARVAVELRAQYLERLCGRTLDVLVEGTVNIVQENTPTHAVCLPGQPTMLQGTAERYVSVRWQGDEKLVGQIVSLKTKSLGDDWLIS